MKKIIVILTVVLSVGLIASESVFAGSNRAYQQHRINRIGFNLLNRNEIEQHIVFGYSDSSSLRSRSTADDRTVYIPDGLIDYTENEDELAAVTAYEIAYCLKYYDGPFSKVTVKISPKKHEAYADKRAVDILAKAGYNPLALITVINKTYGQAKSDILSQHTKTSVRLARIYEYILRKYPDKLNDKKYKTNIYYQNFLLTSRYNRSLLDETMKKEPFSTKRIQYR